jgi:hypothetical protein
VNSEDINDAELDAFLKGEDALSGELQAMQQASPSAELDASILSRAEAQMARESRPAAANDASDGRASKAPLSPLGLRWRVPAGIAATLMAGMLAHQAWQASTDLDRAAEVRMPAPAPISAPAPRAVEAEKPAPEPATMAAKPAPPAHVKQPAPHRGLPALAVPSADAYAPEVASPPPPPTSKPTLSYAPAPAPAPAPVAAAPSAASEMARAAPEQSRKVEVSGRRSRVASQDSAQAGTPDPKAWLAAIEELLKAGLRRDTLEEWDKFRAAYPDYPVPAETTDKINALRK